MIYLYGLAAAEPAKLAYILDGVQGLQGPLQFAAIGPWTLVFSDHDDQEILPKRRLLLAHTKVLETILPLCTVLPARFGLVAGDLPQVAKLVTDHTAQIAAQFAKVTGAVEVGLRVSFPRQAALEAALHSSKSLQEQQAKLRKSGPEAHFAIAAFGGRLAELVDQRRGDAQRSLLAALRPLARDHVLRAPDDDTQVLRAEFLIDEVTLPAFQDQVSTLAAELDFAPKAEPLIQVIGPVPMYHFVRLNLGLELDQAAA